MTKPITEKTLGIKGDYQYRAIRSRNFFQANWHRNKWLVVDKLINLYQPQTVLDLGTGSGNFELNFATKVKKIVGLDYNDEALTFLGSELKSKKITNVHLINQDINKLADLSLGKFDLILIVDVLEHIPLPSVRNLVAGLANNLNPKGKIIIVTPNYQGLWPIVERLVDRFTNLPNLEDIQHVTKFNIDLLETVFNRDSFKIVQRGTFNTFSYLFPIKILSSLLCLLEMRLPFLWGNLIYAVFEKSAKI